MAGSESLPREPGQAAETEVIAWLLAQAAGLLIPVCIFFGLIGWCVIWCLTQARIENDID